MRWLPRKIKPQSEIRIEKVLDKAYFAGLFDGEGSFTIRVDGRKSPPEFHPLIRIFMSDETVIKELAHLFGYTYIPIKKEREGRKLKTMYGITISIEKDVRDLLEQLLPYLRVKKRQAELILELMSLKQANSGCKRTRDIVLKEFELWNEVRKLNPKGRQPTKEYYEKLRNKIREFFK